MEQSNISKSHKLSMDNRKRLTLTGIKDVVSFDLTQILLESTLGMIHIKGSDIKVTRLSLEKGEVDIEGTVDSIVYSDVKDYGEKGKSRETMRYSPYRQIGRQPGERIFDTGHVPDSRRIHRTGIHNRRKSSDADE